MVADIGAIRATLVADTGPLDAGLRVGATRVQQFEKQAADRFRYLDRAMLKTGSIAGGLGAKLAELGKSSLIGLSGKGMLAVGSFVSFSAAIAGAKSALEQFGDIADKSAAAGLDPEYFQGLAYAAKLAGVDIETLSSALNTLNKNSGLASEGKGKLVSQLQSLAPELLKNIQLATTQEARVRAVADAIAAQTDASRQAAIATAAFGGEGVKLVAVLKDGGAAIDSLVTRAKEMGIVVDRSLIERADELGDKLDTASQIIRTKINVGLVALAPLMSDAAGWAAEFARLMGVAYEQTKAIEDRQFIRPLQNELADTYNQIGALKERIAEYNQEIADGNQAPGLRFDITEAERNIETLTAKADELLKRIQVLQGWKPPAESGPPADPREALLSGMAGRGGPGRIKPVQPFYTPGGDKPSSSRNDDAAAAIREAQAVSDVIAELSAERDAIGKTAAEQRVATELRKAGVAATAEQQAQIASLVTTIESENDALDKLEDAYATAEGYAQSFAQSLITDLSEGKSVAESLSNAFRSLGQQLLKMAADQAIKSLFQNLLGAAIGGGLGGYQPFGGPAITPSTGLPPLFDRGGFTGVGGKYQPAGIVHKGEYVFDAAAVRRIGVGKLEALRGYADGGYVNGSTLAPLPANSNERRTSGDDGLTINLNVYGVTDADSFQRSSSQVTTTLARAVGRARRFS